MIWVTVSQFWGRNPQDGCQNILYEGDHNYPRNKARVQKNIQNRSM